MGAIQLGIANSIGKFTIVMVICPFITILDDRNSRAKG